MAFQTVPHISHNEEAIAQNANSVGAWTPAKGAEGFNFELYMTSTGAPDVTVTMEYTFLHPGYKDQNGLSTDGKSLLDPDSTVRTNYHVLSLSENVTTKGSKVLIAPPSALGNPISHFRIRITENNAGAVDTITFITLINGMR